MEKKKKDGKLTEVKKKKTKNKKHCPLSTGIFRTCILPFQNATAIHTT